MIVVSGTQTFDLSVFSDLERTIFMLKNNSEIVYRYDSFAQLAFELKLRAELVYSSQALSMSGASFATFKNSRCNRQYWDLTSFGGFRIKKEVTPAAGIRDIFANGRLYAFECATAMVIVLYNAVMNCIGEHQFNRLFADILLWDWHYDKDLVMITVNSSRHAYPGDILYFKNPDVNPARMEWQGLNVVKLAENLYYGHGFGIMTGERIIAILNTLRKPNAVRSAYLYDQKSFPDFNHLFAYSPAGGGHPAPRQLSREHVTAKVGSSTYLHI